MFHSRWTGSHYAAGLKYGAMLRKHGMTPQILQTPERRAFAEACIPLYQAHYPQILEEIRGVAEGLHRDFMEIAEFLCSMYCYVFDSRCSTIAFSAQGKTVFARNSDFSTSIEGLCDSPLYRLQGCPAFLGNTTAWTEIEDGVNEWGLAVGLTFVYPVKIAPGLNAGMLVRYLLERCKTTDQAICALERLPIASAQTITLADPSGKLAVVECNCDRMAVLRPQPGTHFVFATNHFVSPEMQPYQYSGVDDCHSHQRYQTCAAAFQQPCGAPVAFAMDLLAGKSGFLCQYDRSQGMDTIWSVVYDLTDSKIFRAEGNPARKRFRADPRTKALGWDRATVVRKADRT